MLGIAIEKVCDFIVRVKGFDATVPAGEADPDSDLADVTIREVPEDEVSEDEVVEDEVSEDYAGDSAFAELKEFLDALNEEELYNLVALTWLGRGTYDKDEWQSALDEARSAHNDHTADYLLGTPLIGTYLEDGLDQLGYSCE